MYMETSPVLFSFIFLSIGHALCTYSAAASGDDCRPSSCSPTGPEIRFPFRLAGRQPSHCGFPGFTLSCDAQNRTVYTLPSSKQPLIVHRIDYYQQAIYVDPGFCTPGGISGFDLAGTPFDSTMMRDYLFFNCSVVQTSGFMYPATVFPCLSGENYTVVAMKADYFSPGGMPASCQRIGMVSVPFRRYTDVRGGIGLLWFTPYCRQCEIDGKSCRLQGNDNETGCSASSRRTFSDFSSV